MKFHVKVSDDFTKERSPAFVLFVFENEMPKTSAALVKLLASVTESQFNGKANQFLMLPTHGKLAAERIALVGLGKKEKYTIEIARRAAATAARKLKDAGVMKFSMGVCPDCPTCSQSECVEALAQGVTTGPYGFDRYKAADNKGKSKPEIKEVTLCLSKSRGLVEAQKAARRGQIIGESVNYTRDVANEPGNVIYPATMADRARKLARETGMKCTVLDPAALERLGCGAILAVGMGSVHTPRIIVLEYRGGKPSQKPYAFVGKAITFDSGGISLKPGAGMADMKWDKSGGCGVLGAMRAVAKLKLPVNIVGVISAAENLPSGTSYRPGDIVYAYPGQRKGGKSIEILNTDAEGRVVLADALSYVSSKYEPRAIVDIATLTGACVVALGGFFAGLLSNNDELVEKVKAASKRSGDAVWQMPITDDYREQVKADYADVKNVGATGQAGTQAGAVFLEKFVNDRPWAHVDIAGTAWGDEKSFRAKGATGFGVRLLVEFVS